jgi:hypothetical protein
MYDDSGISELELKIELRALPNIPGVESLSIVNSLALSLEYENMVIGSGAENRLDHPRPRRNVAAERMTPPRYEKLDLTPPVGSG